MREISAKEQKEILLSILIEFDRVCRLNNCRYSLAYGTLLGAVRHKGFIPWDDDIDVLVSREDYVKLQSIFNEQSNSQYRFVCVENEKRFSAPLGKVIDTSTVLRQLGHNSDRMDLGVYIDVFPYDYVPEEKDRRAAILNAAVRRQKYWSFCGNNYGNHNILVRLIRKILNHTPLARAIAVNTNRWASNLIDKSSVMAALVFGLPEREKNTIATEDLQDLQDYEFEGRRFLGIKASDHYLKQWYGDYMQLPPADQQVSNHDIKVFMKEE